MMLGPVKVNWDPCDGDLGVGWPRHHHHVASAAPPTPPSCRKRCDEAEDEAELGIAGRGAGVEPS